MKRFLFIMSLLLSFGYCLAVSLPPTAKGNMPRFTEISNNTSVDIYFATASTYYAEVMGTDNDRKTVKLQVDNGVLRIVLPKGRSNLSNRVRVRVACPALSKIENRGSADFFAKKTIKTTSNFKVVNRGSGDVLITNLETGRFYLSNFGSGDIAILRSKVNEMNTENRGSGDMALVVDVFTKMTLKNYGSGDVKYTGSNRDFSIENFGSGDVEATTKSKSLSLVSRGSGDIEIMGSANTCTKYSRGSGDIYTDRLKIDKSNH